MHRALLVTQRTPSCSRDGGEMHVVPLDVGVGDTPVLVSVLQLLRVPQSFPAQEVEK